VTISGQLDAGIQSTKNGDGAVVTNMGTGIHGASRLRFVGVEDLGGGNKANFWLEMQPDFTNGTTNAAGLFNRGAWAGLQGNWGELRLGRQGTNTIGTVCTIDQHGCYSGFYGGGLLFSGQGAPGAQGSALFAANVTRGGLSQATGLLAPFATTSAATGAATAINDPIKDVQGSSTGAVNQTNADKFSADSTRYVRAVRYSLPTLVTGLSLNATYAFAGTLPTGKLSGGNTTGADATYANGPLAVVASYQKTAADVAGYASGDLTTIGGTYDFAVAKVGLGYQREGAAAGSLNVVGTATELLFKKAEAYGLTVTVPMGAATPYFKYAERKYTGGTMGDVTGAKIANIGVRYALSKRSLIYVDYVDNGAAMGAGTTTKAKLGAVAGLNTNGITGYTGSLKNMTSIGIQHNF
jgi:predicted porin